MLSVYKYGTVGVLTCLRVCTGIQMVCMFQVVCFKARAGEGIMESSSYTYVRGCVCQVFTSYPAAPFDLPAALSPAWFAM